MASCLLEMRLCPTAGAGRSGSCMPKPFQVRGPLSAVSKSSRGQALKAAQEQDADTSLSGEWPVNWSLASYEDVGEFFQQNLFKDQASPGTTLRDVMSSALKVVTPDDRLDQLGNLFNVVRAPPSSALSGSTALVSSEYVLAPALPATIWPALSGVCLRPTGLGSACGEEPERLDSFGCSLKKGRKEGWHVR